MAAILSQPQYVKLTQVNLVIKHLTICHCILNKMAATFTRNFQMHFVAWICKYSDSNFSEVCFKVSDWQQVIIGSGNGLVLQNITITAGLHSHLSAKCGMKLLFHSKLQCMEWNYLSIPNLQHVGWNYLSIPKLQRCNRWSLGMDK